MVSKHFHIYFPVIVNITIFLIFMNLVVRFRTPLQWAIPFLNNDDNRTTLLSSRKPRLLHECWALIGWPVA